MSTQPSANYEKYGASKREKIAFNTSSIKICIAFFYSLKERFSCYCSFTTLLQFSEHILHCFSIQKRFLLTSVLTKKLVLKIVFPEIK